MGTCHKLVERCQKSKTCEPLFDSWMTQCGNVTKASLSSRPICTDDCRQAFQKLFSDPLGSELKCCDCGKLSPQQLSSIPPLGRMPPTGGPMQPTDGRMPPMRPGNTSRPRNTPVPTRPTMMSTMPSMMNPMSPVGCYIARVNMERHCNLTDDDCTECNNTRRMENNANRNTSRDANRNTSRDANRNTSCDANRNTNSDNNHNTNSNNCNDNHNASRGTNREGRIHGHISMYIFY